MTSPAPPDEPSRRRRWLPVTVIVAGALLLGVAALGLTAEDPSPIPSTPAGAGAARAAGQGEDPLSASISRAQDKLRRTPADASTWAELGSAFVEQARTTADPSYYDRAQGALDRSMQLRPQGNGTAMIGLGALANARHDFGAGRDWAQRAQALRPATAAVYGVLADSLTQLGDDVGATAAVQRMLDLEPGVASFTRASYDLELHGRVDASRAALERALTDSVTPANIAFCRYYLGELAFTNGQLDEAAAQYEQGLQADPDDAPLLQGRAKVAAARGALDVSLSDYDRLTRRLPLPQYIQEYGELLLVAGRPEQARQQFTLYTQQQRLYQASGAADDLAVSQFAADHGDPAEALRRAEAEWSRRQSVFVADALAWALHVNGRDVEAVGYAEQAGRLGWRNATFAYHRGMILKGVGRDGEAREQLTEALRINPHFSPLHAPRARQALTELRAGG